MYTHFAHIELTEHRKVAKLAGCFNVTVNSYTIKAQLGTNDHTDIEVIISENNIYFFYVNSFYSSNVPMICKGQMGITNMTIVTNCHKMTMVNP